MKEHPHRSDETHQLAQVIEQLNAGDPAVRGELLNLACGRLIRLTARLRRHFQGIEGAQPAEDVFEHASLRLYQALHDTPIKDVRHFYRLAATQIRRELIDLCRQCQSLDAPPVEVPPCDAAAQGQPSLALDVFELIPNREPVESQVTAAELRQWAHFHDSVDGLPDVEREVFELIWYHELCRDDAAGLLGVPVQEVRRLWRSARLHLHDLLGCEGVLPRIGED
ncbi:MAG: sigma-70 family RNA polymerase sigma factor [Rubripirellula sp.]|nr:sigma-70 family RNA polymerase sigma factor [Rubripirellula sp.]